MDDALSMYMSHGGSDLGGNSNTKLPGKRLGFGKNPSVKTAALAVVDHEMGVPSASVDVHTDSSKCEDPFVGDPLKNLRLNCELR